MTHAPIYFLRKQEIDLCGPHCTYIPLKMLCFLTKMLRSGPSFGLNLYLVSLPYEDEQHKTA